MILRDDITKIVKSQRNSIINRNQGVIRHDIIKIHPHQNFAIILSGIRRCGKSTLLVQMMKKEENFYYLNFEDPRLIDFTIQDYEVLEEVFHQEYGFHDLYFFDEIQNLSGWEYYIRHLLDSEKKVIITGSHASLLSRELGTKLTGRNLRLELFPFSYQEYLEYTHKEDSDTSFNDYLFTGGFPEYIRVGLEEVLQNLLLDIIARDIIYRNNIKNPALITEIAVYLLGNIAREMTLSQLQKIFSAIGSVTTIASYISHLEDAYILFTLPRFSYSHKSRQINPKKVYAVDNGLIYANTTGFTEDYGRLLENLVFIMLRKKYRELFYFREKHECDFIVKEKTKVTRAIQVCYEVTSRNKDREIRGLLEAMEMFDLKEGYILTGKQEDLLTVDGRTIILMPARSFAG
ncbi:conserved hypothetical protein [Methanospirillum hungatei JF-1]|uniref:ATPase n=1 Tax=Methanospirillum hungatei JF-1 (strain ATCC 27890 / DSM 864 / NBRC 100397 / JF-1) TaxID=323259 RepID=Q2FP16_METHJ|nr:ATP-binding protein [Methanospirillum hungatei]ABD41144.1 conserved hypothetical protein [Methanospirillum hungatei JF-1]